jgi:hypothetical protein
MPKKRRLTDLYKVGKDVTINDETGGSAVRVHIRKLNPVDHETALRRANAMRAKVLAAARDEDSDIYGDVMSEVLDMDRDALVSFAISEDVGKISASTEAEMAAEDEWSKDDYLQGLYDLWNSDLAARYHEEPDDSEVVRVRNELVRFEQSVAESVDSAVVKLRADLEEVEEIDLQKTAVSKLIDIRADTEWIKEFRRCEIWLAVRDEDKKTRYFESRAEVDELESEVLGRLVEEYQSLAVEPLEGKSSPRTDTSSNSSDPQGEPEQDQPSSQTE